jgi:hypothetical protein
MQSAHEAAGATGIRRSPRPLWGERFINGSGALRGEGVNVCLDVIASEAKQSILTFFVLDGLLRFARNDGLCSLKIEPDVIRDERQGYRLRTGR